MNYAAAKAIIEEIAPELTVDADKGHAHIVVRKTIGEGDKARLSPPFSIMLPVSTDAVPMDDAQEREVLAGAVNAARSHL